VSGGLFAYVELESEDQWRHIADTDTCQRWWRHMRDLMPTNQDNSPVSRDLREVFHLDRAESGSVAGEMVAPTGEKHR
jgi:L-rhamnose mutarotase